MENIDIGRKHLTHKHEDQWNKLFAESDLQVMPVGNTLYVHENPTIMRKALKPLFDTRKKSKKIDSNDEIYYPTSQDNPNHIKSRT